MDIDSIVKRAKAKDENALAEIYSEYYQRLYFFILNHVKSPSDAEDILQNTFIEVFKSIGSLDEPKAFKSWLYLICKRQIIAFSRKNERQPDIAGEIDETHETADDDSEFLPGDLLESDEMKSAVMDMVLSLPDTQKSAILLYYYEEMSVKEIAAAQDCSEGTVKSRLNYARSSIREKITKRRGKGDYAVSVAPLPLIVLLLRDFSAKRALSPTAADAVLEFVCAETGIAVAGSVIAAAGTGAAAASAGTGAGAAATAGAAAGAGMTLTAKAVALVCAAAVVATAAIAYVATQNGYGYTEQAYSAEVCPELLSRVSLVNGTLLGYMLLPDGRLWLVPSGYRADIPSRHMRPREIAQDVIAVAACGLPTFFIKDDNSLWAIPAFTSLDQLDGFGQSGLIHVWDDVTHVSTRLFTTLIIKSDGSLWEWGIELIDHLSVVADGEAQSIPSPRFVMDDAVYVAAGASHSVAIRSDESLWGWGLNTSGALGLGYCGGFIRYEPRHIMDDIVMAAASTTTFTVALGGDGRLWSWGGNRSGQIGDGTTADRYSPVQIMDNVIAFSVGSNHTAAITQDSVLWAWGINYVGQIGDGTLEARHSPVRVMENVTHVAPSQAGSTMAVTNDGALWAWGGILTPYGMCRVPVRIIDNVLNQKPPTAFQTP